MGRYTNLDQFRKTVSTALEQESFHDFSQYMDGIVSTIKPADIETLLDQLVDKSIPREEISFNGELARAAAIILGSDFTSTYSDYARELFHYDPMVLYNREFPEDQEDIEVLENVVTMIDGLANVDEIGRGSIDLVSLDPRVAVVLMNSWLGVETARSYPVPNLKVRRELVGRANSEMVPDNPWEFFPYADMSNTSIHPIGNTDHVAWVIHNGNTTKFKDRGAIQEYIRGFHGREIVLAIPYNDTVAWAPLRDLEKIKNVFLSIEYQWDQTAFGRLLRKVYSNIMTQTRRSNFFNTVLKTSSLRLPDELFYRIVDILVDDSKSYIERLNLAILELNEPLRQNKNQWLKIRLLNSLIESIKLIENEGPRAIGIRDRCVQKMKRSLTLHIKPSR